MKYLLSLPGVGGYYGATIGAAKNIIDRINKKDPNAIIHYSGVSSGAFCALMMLLSFLNINHKHSHTKYISQIHKEFIECVGSVGKWSDSIFDYYHNNDLFFAGVEKFIRMNIKDIKTINNKLILRIHSLKIRKSILAIYNKGRDFLLFRGKCSASLLKSASVSV